MNDLTEPLPCIVCGMQPESAFGADHPTHQPYKATMFDAGSGHYGSTVWDTMTDGRTLMVNVCDDCLVARKDRVALVLTVRQPSAVEFLPWEPGRD